MAQIAFTRKELDCARRKFAPGEWTLEARLVAIENAILVIANELPDYEAGCRVWDELRSLPDDQQ
jgi:hypothetical protein